LRQKKEFTEEFKDLNISYTNDKFSNLGSLTELGKIKPIDEMTSEIFEKNPILNEVENHIKTTTGDTKYNIKDDIKTSVRNCKNTNLNLNLNNFTGIDLEINEKKQQIQGIKSSIVKHESTKQLCSKLADKQLDKVIQSIDKIDSLGSSDAKNKCKAEAIGVIIAAKTSNFLDKHRDSKNANRINNQEMKKFNNEIKKFNNVDDEKVQAVQKKMLKNFERSTREKQTFLSKFKHSRTEKSIDNILKKIDPKSAGALKDIREALRHSKEERSQMKNSSNNSRTVSGKKSSPSIS